jgi:acyl-CoA thioesterase YciA
MAVAGGIVAYERANGRVASVAIDAMTFLAPVLVGDVVSCFAEVVRVGRTSLTVQIETWVHRARTGERVKVTEGNFTYVALDQTGGKREIPPENC